MNEFLKKFALFVGKHGADKVLEALEGVADQSLDDLVKKLPDDYGLIAKTAEQLGVHVLHKYVTRLEKKLGGEGDETPEDEAS